MLFNKNEKLKKLQVEVDSLNKEKEKLEKENIVAIRDLAILKSEKKIEEEQIKHLVKIKDEKRELEYKRKEIDLEAEKNNEIAAVKDEYRDKLECNLVAQKDDIKGMYSEILKRLPDVNAVLKGKL